jgi:hypothetical protein
MMGPRIQHRAEYLHAYTSQGFLLLLQGERTNFSRENVEEKGVNAGPLLICGSWEPQPSFFLAYPMLLLLIAPLHSGLPYLPFCHNVTNLLWVFSPLCTKHSKRQFHDIFDVLALFHQKTPLNRSCPLNSVNQRGSRSNITTRVYFDKIEEPSRRTEQFSITDPKKSTI